MNPRTAARVAGAALVVMAVLAIPANALTSGGAVVSGAGFRTGVMAWFAVGVLDVIVAWALHLVFRRTQPDVSALAAAFRIGYAGVLVVATGFLVLAIDRPADASLARAAFASTWTWGLGIFGLHLLLIGWLALRTSVPRLLAWAVVLAGAAYSLDTAAHVSVPDYASYAQVATVLVAVPAVVGELGLAVWMLLRGVEPDDVEPDDAIRTRAPLPSTRG